MKNIVKASLSTAVILMLMVSIVNAGTVYLQIGLDGKYKGIYTSAQEINNRIFIGTDALDLLGFQTETDLEKNTYIIRNQNNKQICKIDIGNIGPEDSGIFFENSEVYLSIPKAASLLKLEYEMGKGSVHFYSSKAKKSQLHFDLALLKMAYPTRFSELKEKTDRINEECKKLDNGGALDEKKLNAQFESIFSASKALRKDIGKLKAEDAKMKTAKNMLISGFELLESAMRDLKKVTVTKDLGLFESYRMKINKANGLYTEGWAMITEGL